MVPETNMKTSDPTLVNMFAGTPPVKLVASEALYIKRDGLDVVSEPEAIIAVVLNLSALKSFDAIT